MACVHRTLSRSASRNIATSRRSWAAAAAAALASLSASALAASSAAAWRRRQEGVGLVCLDDGVERARPGGAKAHLHAELVGGVGALLQARLQVLHALLQPVLGRLHVVALDE